MPWADGLRKGSFRGAAFEFNAAGGEHGRRAAEHVYPLRDGAEGEDMGMAVARLTLDVFVIDADFSSYAAKRDALIAACEKPGAGQLIHPTVGTILVFCSCRWSESVEQMGVCHFELTVWKPENASAIAGSDTAGTVDAAATTAKTAAATSMASRFSVSSLEKQVSAGFQSTFGPVLSVIKTASSTIALATALPGQIVGFVDGQAANAIGFFSGVSGLQNSIGALVNLPSSLAFQFEGLIESLSFTGASNTPITISDWTTARLLGPQSVSSTAQTPQGYAQTTLDGVRQAQLAIYDQLVTTDVAVLLSAGALPASGVGAPLQIVPDIAGVTSVQARAIAATTTPAGRQASPPIPGITPGQLQAAINQTELLDLGRRVALTEAAEAAIASQFVCSNDAIAVRDDLMMRFEAEIATTTDTDVKVALIELKLAVFRDITATAADLPSLSTIVLPRAIPALVLAHRLYDDPSYADDIVARNKVSNALFVPAGVPIEVLSNG